MRFPSARALVCFFAGAILPLVQALAADERPATTLSLNERACIASRAYASLANFAHWRDVPDLDVEAAYRTYLDKALAANDRVEFSRASIEFLAGFRNAHTMFVDRRLVLDGGDLPFTAAYLDGKWVVTQSWSEGVNRGDIVESIDGEPFERFFANHRRYISASTEPFARRALFGRHPFFVPYAHLFPKKFVVGLDGGHSVSVDRSKLAPAPLEQTDGRWLEPGKVAYIRIPSFGAPEYEKRAIELLRELRQAAVLIVDVRGNSGGSTPSGLLAQLMDRPYHWWSESTSVTMPYFRYRASQGEWQYQPFNRPEFVWPSSVSQPAQDSFKGKMALLVDAGCLSACEDFTMPFKDNGRALLVGETTGGSTGQPFFLDLGNEMFLVVGAKRAMFPDGSRFEGVGISPNVEIKPTLDDVKKGRDAALEAARKQLGA